MCPVEPQVAAYYGMCARVLLYVPACYDMCPHTTVCVLFSRRCPHTTTYVSACYDVSAYHCTCPPSRRCRSMHSMCLNTTIYVSAYYYICVRILLYMCLHASIMCPHTIMCVRILLYMCPHNTMHLPSSYYHICVPIPVEAPTDASTLQQRCNRLPPLATVCVHIPYVRYYICVLIPVLKHQRALAATTLQQAPSYYCMCPHIIYALLHMCPHTTIYVSSYRCRHPL
jgi:hypothetical protein